MITELTKEQELKLEQYKNEGIKIGIATGAEIDEELVRSLTDNHRLLCDVPAAKVFKVYDSPFAACKDIPSLTPNNALYGQHDIHWLMTYMFYRNELGLVKETEKIPYLFELCKHIGWFWMSSDTTIITRRPIEIHLTQKKDVQVLHNENGLALEYLDGTGIYSLNGLQIPFEYEWIVTTPADELNVSKVLEIKNTEVRTEVMKKVGLDKYKDSLNLKLLDEWHSKKGGIYKLYDFELLGNRRVYLDMNCPSSHKPAFEPIHPDCTTSQMALNWREEETFNPVYVEPEDRT